MERSISRNHRSSASLDAVVWPWRRGRVRGGGRAEQEVESSLQDVSAAAQDMIMVREPVPVPDEPNLFFLPNDLRPAYGSVPLLVQFGVGCLSAIVAAFWSLAGGSNVLRARFTWMQLFLHWKTVVTWFLETAVLFAMSRLVLQELGWPPARIPVSVLQERYYLPSRLSRYDADLGIHYLHVTHSAESRRTSTVVFDALYVNHGFGASSLSWLPALPVLTARLNCRHGLGHDARGFGFSARSSSLKDYTSEASAQVGLHLLLQQQPHASPGTTEDRTIAASTPSNLVLLGHSMGAATTLRMARKLQEQGHNHRQHIVLVAPALGLRKQTIQQASPTSGVAQRRRWWQPVRFLVGSVKTILSNVAGRMARWTLRRVVGTRGFWRRGLSLAWGDPNRLTDTDVLRFQWPSILTGWEQGLLDFARAQGLPVLESDQELLDQVLQDPNTQVSVMLGSNDRVVRPEHVHKFFQKYPAVKVKVLPGLGHDPFEEDVHGFVDEVEKLLQWDGL